MQSKVSLETRRAILLMAVGCILLASGCSDSRVSGPEVSSYAPPILITARLQKNRLEVTVSSREKLNESSVESLRKGVEVALAMECGVEVALRRDDSATGGNTKFVGTTKRQAKELKFSPPSVCIHTLARDTSDSVAVKPGTSTAQLEYGENEHEEDRGIRCSSINDMRLDDNVPLSSFWSLSKILKSGDENRISRLTKRVISTLPVFVFASNKQCLSDRYELGLDANDASNRVSFQLPEDAYKLVFKSLADAANPRFYLVVNGVIYDTFSVTHDIAESKNQWVIGSELHSSYVSSYLALSCLRALDVVSIRIE